MKTKGLIFVSCLAAGALIASPAMGKPAKKSSDVEFKTNGSANDTGEPQLSP